MIRIAINLFDAQESRKHRNLVTYDKSDPTKGVGTNQL